MHGYPDELEVKIERMAQGGDAVGRWQGRVVFVRGALPDECVRARLTKRAARYAHGYVLHVLTPSAERVAPRLPGADHMPWQYIAYPAQLRFKQAIVQEQLAKLAGLSDVPVYPVLAAPHPWAYRNTARLHVQGQQAGYFATGSRRVVDLPEDPLLLPVLNESLRGLRMAMHAGDWQLEAVTLRASASYGYAVALLRGAGDLESLAAAWRASTPSLAGVVCDGEPSDVTLHEEVGGVVFSLGLDSFFQVYTAQAARLLDAVRAGLALAPGQRLLDAYSGVGTFALPLAQDGAVVVAVEENPHAVADGVRSAHLNGVDNHVRFITAPVERVLMDLEPPFAAAILNPPRRGCHPQALTALIALAPRRIVYVACHPGILARDLRSLLAAGYRVAYVQPVDLFPQTPHIESVAVLTRDSE